jgi:hypothetical protein
MCEQPHYAAVPVVRHSAPAVRRARLLLEGRFQPKRRPGISSDVLHSGFLSKLTAVPVIGQRTRAVPAHMLGTYQQPRHVMSAGLLTFAGCTRHTRHVPVRTAQRQTSHVTMNGGGGRIRCGTNNIINETTGTATGASRQEGLHNSIGWHSTWAAKHGKHT